MAEDGYSVRAATKEEVDAHYEASRPQPQTPEHDLSVTEITPLNEIGFDDWRAFGVKAANVAVLGTLDFPEGTVPEGFAIPFHFYDEFMKANGFYGAITDMLADEDFQTDFDVQDDMLDDLRDDIKDADTPQWIIDALTAMHAEFPAGQSLRYRSSTNNEDLPGFNGAGLYDSKTQDPEETAADGIDKSLKGVFASLWTFRAFTEREFHRIDHLAAAMGVLVHPNYKDELANGVAVSFDPIYAREGSYYVNSQVGEDLVTNPDAHSVPEELLLGPVGGVFGPYTILGTSNQALPGQLLMTDAQLAQLRQYLEVIHDHFKALYNPAAGEPFAMEIEFKITSKNVLAIKQARPWVFGSTAPPPSDRAGTLTLRSTQPRVGAALTTTLTDPDGSISNISWQWDSSPNAISNWATISGAASARYTPVDGDVGNYLRATASYTDGHGSGKSAQAVSANTVQSSSQPPPPPPPPPTPSPPRGGGGGGGGSSNRPPEITGPKSLRHPEHSTEPVATYKGEDPEGTAIRWEIEDSDHEHLRISEDGVLSFKKPPDYENPVDFRLNNTYEIRLLAFDSGIPSRYGRLQVRIEIKRVNELDPVSGEVQVSIAENHAGVLSQYQTQDPEGDAVQWSLSGPDAALFQIDEAGTLSLSSALDFEALGSAAGTNDYAPTVVATDDGKDPVSQQLEVTVTLTDVNEEPTGTPVPIVELTAGNLPTTLDLSEFFADPDGDSLTYALDAQESPEVASAVVEESSLSITPLEEGTASFVVTASDPSGLSSSDTVEVTVVSPPPPKPTPTPTPEPTPTPTPAPTATPTATATPSPRPVPNATATPTSTATAISTPTPTPTGTPIPIPTPVPTAMPTPIPTPLSTPVSTPTPTIAFTPTPSPTFLETPTVEPTAATATVPSPTQDSAMVVDPETGDEERAGIPAWLIALIVAGFLLAALAVAAYSYRNLRQP